jgi:hypothetical protein
MNDQAVRALLHANRELLAQALPSFHRSLEKCRSFSLEAPFPFEVEESFDALTSKFSRVSDIFTQKVLKSVVLLTREDAPTFLDRMNLCEKIGVITLASDLIEIRDLRNQIAHEYTTENLAEVYRDCMELSDKLLAAIRIADQAIERVFPSTSTN